MFKNVPTSLLALATLGVVGFDLLLAGPIADANEDEVVETPAPEVIPETAFLTGAVQPSALIDGVEVQVLPTEEGTYVLHAKNPDEVDRTLAVRVDVFETSGIMMGRMGPMSTQVGTEELIIAMPAGATVDTKLTYSRPVEPTPGQLAGTLTNDPSSSDALAEVLEVPSNGANAGTDVVQLQLNFEPLFFSTTEFAITSTAVPYAGEIPPMAYLRIENNVPTSSL